MDNPTRYPSRIDGWMGLVLLLVIGMSVYTCVTTLRTGDGGQVPLLLITLSLGIVLPAWILLDTCYILDRDTLMIRSGPLRWRVPFRDVNNIRATHSLLSSPALSLDRLRIEYGRGKAIMISPRDKAAFLHDLDRRRAGVGDPAITAQR